MIIALILSLLSLFIFSSANKVPEQYRQTRLVTGAEVYCDSRFGASPVSCRGEYNRGWPLNFGRGEIFRSVDGDWVESFEISWAGAVVNYLFWIIPSLAAGAIVVVSLYEQKEQDSRD